MSKIISAEQLLKRVSEIGYFRTASFDPSSFIDLVEYKLNISRDRAIKLLLEAGYVTLHFSPDVHPREAQDFWCLQLTEKGIEHLTSSLDEG